MEDTFQLNGTDLLGDDESLMELETSREIEKMQFDFHGNYTKAVDLMVEEVCRVTLAVPAARKQ